MGHIYTYARRVIVWLGEEAEGSQHALEALRLTADQIKLDALKEELSLVLKRDMAPGFSASSSDPLPYSAEQWQAIARFIRRPWFGRLWVRQEAALARDAIVMAGEKTLSWLAFLGAISWIRSKSRGSTELLGSAATPTAFQRDVLNVSSYVGMLADRQVYGMIGYTKGVNCTDDRDRVYAILGMIEPEMAARIHPDYTLDSKSVYRDFVLSYIAYTQRLHMLDFCHNAKAPSWVPDFEMKQPDVPRFTEAIRDVPAVAIVQDTKRLEVRGIRCDTLIRKVASCPEDPTDEDLRRLVTTVLLQYLGDNTAQWPQHRLECLTQSIAAGLVYELKEASFHLPIARLAEVFRQWTSSAQAEPRGSVQHQADESTALETVRESLPGLSLHESVSGDLVITSNHALPGDFVYSIFGCYRTMVLRQIQTEYRVIAPSYHPRYTRSEAICGELPEGWRAFFGPEPYVVFQKDGFPPQKRWEFPREGEILLLDEWATLLRHTSKTLKSLTLENRYLCHGGEWKRNPLIEPGRTCPAGYGANSIRESQGRLFPVLVDEDWSKLERLTLVGMGTAESVNEKLAHLKDRISIEQRTARNQTISGDATPEQISTPVEFTCRHAVAESSHEEDAGSEGNAGGKDDYWGIQHSP